MAPWQSCQKPKTQKVASTKSNMTGFYHCQGTAPVGVDHCPKNISLMMAQSKLKKVQGIRGYNNESDGPQGFIWDGQNYNCAYDSVMTILLSVWSQDPTQWKRQF